jgi:type II secretory pathway pseudopilin PulG
MSAERHKGLRLIEWLIILGIVLVICAIAIPGFLSSHRAQNERNASTSLKTLSSAEADFRANDRDWNHVNDFWTGDVKGLYTMTSAAEKGAGTSPKDPPIKLIELSVALADADQNFIPAGGENMLLPQPSTAKAGYWYAALILDLTLKDTEEATYKRDTGGTPSMGKCHNTSKFGFSAVPDGSSSGKFVFVVNENNTIFRSAVTTPARLGSAVPPGLENIDRMYLNWPDDEILLGPRKKD